MMSQTMSSYMNPPSEFAVGDLCHIKQIDFTHEEQAGAPVGNPMQGTFGRKDPDDSIGTIYIPYGTLLIVLGCVRRKRGDPDTLTVPVLTGTGTITWVTASRIKHV